MTTPKQNQDMQLQKKTHPKTNKMSHQREHIHWQSIYRTWKNLSNDHITKNTYTKALTRTVRSDTLHMMGGNRPAHAAAAEYSRQRSKILLLLLLAQFGFQWQIKVWTLGKPLEHGPTGVDWLCSADWAGTQDWGGLGDNQKDHVQ